MTLKTRLTAMMVLVLVAVVAVQFVMAERERRELAARLQQLSGELDRSTAFFVERVHQMTAGDAPRDVESFLNTFLPDSAAAAPRTRVQVFVLADSVHRGARGPGRVLDRHQVTLDMVEESIVRRDSAGAAGGDLVWFRRALVSGHPDSQLRTVRLEHGAQAQPGRDFVVNLPLPGAHGDSAYSVQMRYSYASLAEELSRSRRRSLVWLVVLLGAGVAAAIVVAGQFTRPIRALESSFARVESGDLGVRVEPQRRDEIGQLTLSFNHMVARLRESQQMSERLVQAEHLASLGRLAAGVAHEIRNPLNAILLNLQQLRDRARDAGGAGGAAASGEFDKYHDRMVNEIQRLERMVGSFLDLAKSAELRTERTDIAAGLRAAVELFRPLAAEHGVHLELEAPETLFATADASRLPAVWNNLLANAIEATPRGGRIAVHADARDGVLEVTVEDNGRGIPEDLHARVWEPFHSGRDGGTGLGLAIVRSTVESHGGRTELESAPGRGTRVRVILPLNGEPGGAA